MTRISFIAIPAVVALAGCMTSGYGYRDGQGDYYYGQPTIEYRHYGYGIPYDSFDYRYRYGGYGDPYWYYGDPYSHYYYYYVPVPQPQPPPTSPPPSGSGDPDASVAHWAREHGYKLRTPVPGRGEGGSTSPASLNQVRGVMQPQPRVRTTTPDSARSTRPTISPPRPQAPSLQATPPRPAYPSRPAPKRSSSSSGDHDDEARLRRRP